MRTILDYIEAAKPNAVRPTENGVALSIGISSVSLNRLKHAHSFPKDETMLALADLAGISRQEALLELNCWRSKSATAKTEYESLLGLLSQSAACLVFPIVTAMSGLVWESGAVLKYIL